jgi:outer membrane protein OmpA-like peptidoglycan-associated protein
MGMANPKGAVVSAAKKKLFGSKSSNTSTDSAAAKPPAPRCLTPEQYSAEMKAQQTAAMKGVATAALTATPVGMAVVGAKAAAPVAGRVAGALSSRFHRGPSKDDMVRDLTAGRLYLENVSFKPGAEDAASGSDKALATLVDALKSADGRFVLKVTPESDGKTPSDAKLAQTRAQHLAAKLQSAGVPVAKVTPAPLTVTTNWNVGAPVKSDAHLELVALPPEHKQ